ncbi:hypothetical protein PAXINDRAFT_15505 [Paxillus involutus ATCC 200175]|uniref:Unplaced genomic scaffold PAXINscaffold_54, whole genome shotgun sequence n=1 Tax=Paxillus involutus ATCC 200175 TaxID=664439 RepID=A0A0C9T7C7_PAXIN|nr:hypothetical protein PAXINDRAFT_15505 [Paxillus involutus ATCC 200175]
MGKMPDNLWNILHLIGLRKGLTKVGEKIDLHDHDTTIYTAGSLHPEIDTGALDGILKKAFGILRDRMVVAVDAVIEDEHRGGDINGDDEVVDGHSQRLRDALAWSPPSEPLLWLVLSKVIGVGVWKTTFKRYRKYHKELLERRPADNGPPPAKKLRRS